ncbi:S8 family serine peptidase [Fluviicola sp.]|uniref:S8 family serine peptidase n=1 Tax=Fluviicola sp. TaxID=1917219 RepID=UPI00283AAF5A|nr:S8 family serine peptidase [Fluviicola sp.]
MRAQTDYYYYYDNQKIYIDLDREFIGVNSYVNNKFPGDYSSNYLSKTDFFENYCRSYVQTKKDTNTLKNYYCEIQVVNSIKDDAFSYTNLIGDLNNNSSTIKASPCFKTATGKRLGLTNNFYVKVQSSSTSTLYEYAQNNNLEVLGKDPYMDSWYILSCTKNNSKNSLEYANQFHESGLFITAEPEFVYHDLQATLDPLYSSQWGMHNTGQYGSSYAGIDIHAEQAWNIATGNNVKVAVYDQGFEMNHPDLVSNVYSTGYDATTGSSPAQVRGDHGTACAGIVGAEQGNHLGITGVAPKSNIVSISINLQLSDTPLQFASGFSWAWHNGVEVISNSWGGDTPSNIITDAINEAIQLGRNGKGCVVVFASGNENNTNIRYPGSAIPEILVVGAMSPCGQRKSLSSCDGENWWGSCYGTQLDIVAPGVKIPTTDRQGGLGYNSGNYDANFNGTSSACPHVAALILSVNPCLTAGQVRDIIEQTAQKVGGYGYTPTSGRPNGTWNNEMGYGLVDAYAAVQKAQSISSTLDLYVKDSPDDIGTVPSTTPYPWNSEDIWIRNYNDNGLAHQNPDYSALGNPNYVSVRVINKSCQASTGNETLTLNWTKAGTSSLWPVYWNSGVTFFNQQINQNIPMGSLIDTKNIPVIQPGQSAIVTFPWIVPNPSDYTAINPEPWHFCLLSRIVTSNDPMTFTEGLYVGDNTLKNNNIAWKNVTVVDVLPNNIIHPGGVIAVGNPFSTFRKYKLEIVSDAGEKGNPIYKDAEVGIKMDDILYQAWKKGGEKSNNIKETREKNVRIVGDNHAVLDNITFAPNESSTLFLFFNFLTEQQNGKDSYQIHVIQKDAETDSLLGGETYIINRYARTPFIADGGEDKTVDVNQPITISAEDISEPALYNWYDSKGNLIYQGKDLQIPSAVAEKYKLEVISTTDGFKDYTEVEVKLNASALQSIAPNPASNSVSIGYKLNGANLAYLMITGYYGSGQNTSNNYILDSTSNQITIDLNSYPTGFYTVALVVNGEIADAKILQKQ